MSSPLPAAAPSGQVPAAAPSDELRAARMNRQAALLAALLVTVGAFFGTWMGSRFASSQEHESFVAEHRQAAYARFIADADDLEARARVFHDSPSTETAEAVAARLDTVASDYRQVRVAGGQGAIDEAGRLACDLDAVMRPEIVKYSTIIAASPPAYCENIELGTWTLKDYETSVEALTVSVRMELGFPA